MGIPTVIRSNERAGRVRLRAELHGARRAQRPRGRAAGRKGLVLPKPGGAVTSVSFKSAPRCPQALVPPGSLRRTWASGRGPWPLAQLCAVSVADFCRPTDACLFYSGRTALAPQPALGGRWLHARVAITADHDSLPDFEVLVGTMPRCVGGARCRDRSPEERPAEAQPQRSARLDGPSVSVV
jgi:hypothetical protein